MDQVKSLASSLFCCVEPPIWVVVALTRLCLFLPTRRDVILRHWQLLKLPHLFFPLGTKDLKQTALCFAAREGHVLTTKFLLSVGADPNILDLRGVSFRSCMLVFQVVRLFEELFV